ncbi:MAG: tRNA 2-selenouridine(34) synthase MnmH [Oligoflexia bacterium]|nr:tRNA 2-selenouridine(34) synthase MnmH [Oligoflexia bacterium]
MFKLIKPFEVFGLSQQGIRFFDVRSPQEFEESAIEGAYSLPLLNNAQRIEIGTLYKQKGASVALSRGLEILKSAEFLENLNENIKKYFGPEKIVSAGQMSSISKLIQECLLVEEGHVKFKTKLKNEGAPQVVFYCWRGGARSKIMATIFSALGFNVGLVEGGHKAWRNEVLNYLSANQYPFELSVLYGLTGCGKTKLLKQWALEGRAVIDLEALASHRGSAFGQIGISELGDQKKFEAKLYNQMRLLEARGFKTVYVEGESKRIGRCQLPDRFMRAMNEGEHIKIEKTLEQRVEHIIDEYIKPTPRNIWLSEASYSLGAIKKRLGGEKYSELMKDLVSGDDATFVKKLLVEYYDKAYAHTKRQV